MNSKKANTETLTFAEAFAIVRDIGTEHGESASIAVKAYTNGDGSYTSVDWTVTCHPAASSAEHKCHQWYGHSVESVVEQYRAFRSTSKAANEAIDAVGDCAIEVTT